jgi:acyl carrier protein
MSDHYPSAQGDGHPGDTPADRVLALIADVLQIDRDELQLDDSIVTAYGVRPTELAVLWRALETAFQLKIPMHAPPTWRTVGHLITYIERRLQAERITS